MLPYCKIYPAKMLMLFALILYSTAGIAVMINALPWGWKFFLCSILFWHGNNYVKRFILLIHSRSVVAFWQHTAEFWCIKMANNEIVNGVLKKNSLISHFLLVLNFHCEQKLKLTIILIPESVGFQMYRRLLIYLNHLSAN